MKDAAFKLVSELTKLPSIIYEDLPNSKRFKIMSRNGVVWNRGNSKKFPKWGNVHYNKSNVLLALDYPISTITDEEVFEKLKLPLIEKFERKTGVYFVKGSDTGAPYDSVRIKLHGKDALNDTVIKQLSNFAKDVYAVSI